MSLAHEDLRGEESEPHYIVRHQLALPFSICLPDGVYTVAINGVEFPVTLRNDMWRFSIGNIHDHGEDHGVGFSPQESLDDLDDQYPQAPYIHKEPVRSFIRIEYLINSEEANRREWVREEVGENDLVLLESTIDIINRFTDIYRSENTPDKASWNVTRFEASEWWLETIYLDDGTRVGPRRLAPDVHGVVPRPLFETPDPAINRIRQKLAADEDPPRWWLTLEHGQTLLRRGNRRLAVPEFYTSLEQLLAEVVREGLEDMGTPETVIGHLVDDASLGYLKGPLLRLVQGDALGGSENAALEQDLMSLRNDLVHGRRRDASRDEAEAARDAAIDVIQMFRPDAKIAIDGNPAPE